MRRARRRALAALLALASPAALRAQTAPLRLGVIPYLTPAAVLQVFEPVREHLARQLQRPVQLFTARDFAELADNARSGEYDLAVLPSHLVRIGAVDWGLKVLARTAGEPTPLLLLARQGGAVRLPAALAGVTLGTIDPLSTTALVLQRWLREQPGGERASVRHARSVSSVLIELDRGDVQLAALARSHIAHLSPEQMAGYSVVATYGQASRVFWTAHGALSPAQVKSAQAALLDFPGSERDGPAGRLAPATLRDTDADENLVADARRVLRPRAGR